MENNPKKKFETTEEINKRFIEENAKIQQSINRTGNGTDELNNKPLNTTTQNGLSNIVSPISTDVVRFKNNSQVLNSNYLPENIVMQPQSLIENTNKPIVYDFEVTEYENISKNLILVNSDNNALSSNTINKKRGLIRALLISFMVIIVFGVTFVLLSVKHKSVLGYEFIAINSSIDDADNLLTINRGDLLLVKVKDEHTVYKKGDTIVYAPRPAGEQNPAELEMLRENSNELRISYVKSVYTGIAESQIDTIYYLIDNTKGAQLFKQNFISDTLVVGEGIYIIPKLGYIELFFMKNLYISIIIIVFLLTFIFAMIKATYKKSSKNNFNKNK